MTTSSFDLAIPTILEHEGGYSDDSADPGGATNYGVSLRFLRGLGDADGDGWLDGDLDHDGDVDADDIRRLTRADAERIYRVQWWERYGYGRLVPQEIATKVFDLAVNMGHGRAVRLLQQALAAVELPVGVDGGLGTETVGAVLLEDESRPEDDVSPPPLLAALRSEAAGFYRLLAARNPDLQRFLNGWLRRAYS